MSDFYEGRMIPLKIADMAIINCNKEIEKLQIENDRLKALTVEMDKTINISQSGCRELKAEVERLTDFTTRTIIPNEELEAENARLKAEVERLKEGNECLDQMHEKEMARSAFLCEEVNRTTAWGRGLESNLSWARAELLMVKAEVERLTEDKQQLEARLDFLENPRS